MRALPLICAGLLAAAGCNPSDLDAAVAKAPVRSLTPPDGFGAPDLLVVAPLPPPSGQAKVAGRLMAAGAQRGSLALFDFNPAGKASGRSLNDPTVRDLLLDTNAPLGSSVLLDDGRLLVGAPNFGATGSGDPALGRTLLLQLQQAPEGGVSAIMSKHLQAGTDQRRFGLAVAAGQVSGGSGQDHVILAQSHVTLFEDGSKSIMSRDNTCDVDLEVALAASYSFRALVVGELLESPGEEIAVGVPHNRLPGKVVILAKIGEQLGCPVTLEPPQGTPEESRTKFGAALALADLDGDGRKELVVGAPPDRIFVFTAPFTSMSRPSQDIPPPGLTAGLPGGDFGRRLAIVDVDDMAGPEIAVGAPDAEAGGKPGAGRVYLLRPNGTLVMTLTDSTPSDRAGFGSTLAEMRFAAPGCDGRPAAEHRVLVIGSDKELFVFFRLPGLAREPRCFGAVSM